MYEASDKDKRKMLESDALLSAVNDIVSIYDALVEKRNIAFARAVLDSATKSGLGYNTAKLTLEATLALADKHSTSNHLELLPEAVALVYALTPDKTKELRMAFLNELKQQAYLDMPTIRENALKFYVPCEDEIRQYVASLPKEGHALLLKSGETNWAMLAANYPKYREAIIHFSRVESQFKTRLRDYLPAPSSS